MIVVFTTRSLQIDPYFRLAYVITWSSSLKLTPLAVDGRLSSVAKYMDGYKQLYPLANQVLIMSRKSSGWTRKSKNVGGTLSLKFCFSTARCSLISFVLQSTLFEVTACLAQLRLMSSSTFCQMVREAIFPRCYGNSPVCVRWWLPINSRF